MLLAEYNRTTKRESFSDWLPWIVYDETTKLFYNNDNSIGFILELAPIPYASKNSLTSIRSIFDTHWPKNTILQFILYADPYQDAILNHYKQMRIDNAFVGDMDYETRTFLKKWSNGYCDYLINHRNSGISAEIPVPFRNFRSFFVAKTPCSFKDYESDTGNVIAMQGNIETVRGTFKAANVYSEPMGAEKLIHWMHRIFNPSHKYPTKFYYDKGQEIRKQIIESDTLIKVNNKHMNFDGWNVKMMSPRQYDSEPDAYTTNLLLGDLSGSNLRQIPCPFMLTLNVDLRDAGKSKEKKANIVLAQQAAAAIAPKLMRKQKEYTRALNMMEDGNNFISGYYSLALFTEDDKKMEQATSIVRSLWEFNGYSLQEEMFVQQPFFQSSLPLGINHLSIEDLKRKRTTTSETLSILSPIQADWHGSKTPVMLFLSRRGQLIPLDFFDSSTNYNVFVCGSSGGGKSFLINYVVTNYLSIGCIIFIIDIGRSYKKQCQRYKGQYIQFEKNCGLSLNIFSELTYEMFLENIGETELEGSPNDFDVESLLTMFTQLLAQMANPTTPVTDYERALISKTIILTYKRMGPGEIVEPKDFIETLYDIQKELDKNGTDDRRPSDLAIKLEPYADPMLYGKWFKGKFNVEFEKHFMVLELEEFNSDPNLREVVLMLLLLGIERKIYRSSKEIRKGIIIDEAWELFRGANTGRFIEGFYRKIRKYNGFVCSMTQGIKDLYSKKNEDVGNAIVGNSAYKIYLRPDKDELAQAIDSNFIVLNEFERHLMETIHTVPGSYSEFYLKTPEYFAVGRLFVDDPTKVLFNTRGKIMDTIDACQEKGMSLDESIQCVLDEGYQL